MRNGAWPGRWMSRRNGARDFPSGVNLRQVDEIARQRTVVVVGQIGAGLLTSLVPPIQDRQSIIRQRHSFGAFRDAIDNLAGAGRADVLECFERSQAAEHFGGAIVLAHDLWSISI